MLYLLLAFVTLLITAGTFYLYVQSAETSYFVISIVFLVATVILGGLFMSGRVNKNEDIHITD